MIKIHPKFVVDEQQNCREVLVSYEEWQKIVEMIEELDDIKSYDAAKSSPSEPLPFEYAIKEIKDGNVS